MKLKRDMMIIALIVVMLFTVSAVCAADGEIQDICACNSTDAVGAVDDKIDDANEILAVVNDFDDLNETINGDSSGTYVELERDYHGSFDGGNGIQINRPNVVIDGKGYNIDCTGENSRMFNIDVDGITLKNIVFTGGISDCGGAIYTNNDLTIINCTFSGNQATGTGFEDGGGAIYGNDVKMSIYDCTFTGNRAANGGAICAMGENSNNCEIFNSTFISNVADTSGGAFYSGADSRMGEIINSIFIDNGARSGDAIYMWADMGTIDRCAFINNTANSMIYAPYTILTLSNSIIVNNYGDSLVEAADPIIDYNWWGTTADDEESPVVNGDTLSNYYVLNMTVDDDSADITLNNLYDNGVIITSYDRYVLPSINLTIKAKNVEIAGSVALGASGAATVEHAPSDEYTITVGYNGVELTREVKPTFKWLSNKLNGEGSEFSLEQDCIYDSAKDSILTNGIEFAKDMTIDGQGHVIDAKGSINIFYFEDNTNSYSLTLKNIVFANAVGNKGAAVYFKGNKIEIINCTFINNTANFEGDAVYVANALSNSNRITESVFAENAGMNSLLCLNLDSNANLMVDNSVFMKNAASKNINATGNVSAEHNWWGNTFENNTNLSKTEGVNVSNWLFVKIDAVPAISGSATISLNNVYDHGVIGTYGEYALQPITFVLGGLGTTASVPEITLNNNGQASYQFRMDRSAATLTASCGDVTAAKKLEYEVVDDGSFRALNEIIFFSDDGSVIELTHDYVYFDNDTITEGIVIPRKITINGNGHNIDAKGKTRIFMIPEGVSHITINNIGFINAKASYGSVIVINKDSNHFNISNCNFINNTATDYGGVMDCVGDECTIENCNFIDNHAVSKAGVIRYYHNTQAYIKNSNFISNRVADGSDGGGVIYVDDGAVNIDRSVFMNNVANERLGSVLYTQKSATITNSIFLNNPGAYSIYGGSGVELTNNWFGNTFDDYNLIVDNAISGVYNQTTLNNWLYLDIKFLGDCAVISLNNAYYKSNSSTGIISDCNLPEITLNLKPANLRLTADNVTIDSTGKALVQYVKSSDDAKLTASYKQVSLTKDVCDFDILQALVNENDVIELGRNFAYSPGDSITDGIEISKNIVIDGKGHTIDAKHQSRIFKVISGNVTLKNINFINGHADSGAAIYCEDGNLTVIGCNFSDNVAYADNSCGGAMVFNGDKLTIDNSRFASNKAENGGALIIENAGTVKLMNTQFSENEAYDYGAVGIFSGSALIDRCTFEDNHANRSVGALYLTVNVKVNSTFFKRNSAKDSGALFYNGDSHDSLVIDFSQFIDNDCCAAYLYSYHARILNSQFINSTSDRGYAIYNGAINELYLSNNTISTDDAEIFSAYGGDISSQVTVTILDNKTIYKHLNEKMMVYLTFCDDNGNLIQVQDFDLLVNSTKTDYIYNDLAQRYEANFTAHEYGSYSVSIADTHLSNLTFKNGEISIVNITNDFSTLQMLIDNTTGTLTLLKDYVFNELTDAGLVDGIVINKNIAIDGDGFTIDAKKQARIFYVESGSAKIKNITLVNGNASHGGAICFEGGNMAILNSKFINNTATNHASAIFNSKNATLTLSDSIFEGDSLKANTIDNYGILYLHNNTISNQSSGISNHGGKLLSPYAATVYASTTFVYGDKTNFTAVIADDNGNLVEEGGDVYFNVGGKLVEAQYNPLAGRYEAEYVFDNAGLVKVNVSCPNINISDNRGVDITVLKKDVEITANDASYIINYGGKYSLTVKGVSNVKVTFTLNGMNIGSAVTDSNGIATIQLSANVLKVAKAGKKNLVIRLDDSNYNAVAKTVRITIGKEKTKITAKKKTFKRKAKTKKYSITLKDSKGKGIKKVQVTIKVGKKTFKAITNAKGKATFKITKLTKKGKYNATIKFKGNACYNACTKKVIITTK